MFKKLALMCAAVVLGLGLSVAPAQASWNACPDNRFCMWENTNYWGETFFSNPVRNVCHSSASWVSSIRNTTDDHVYIYLNSTCTNTQYDLYPGQSAANMNAFGGDNNMKSYKVVS